MLQSITLSSLSWSTPDGHQLFNNLTFTFGGVRAGLVGRNGVGKSTLLRLIAGEIAPDKGELRNDEQTGYVRQQILTSLHRTVADVFDLSKTLALIQKAERGTATVDELSDIDWLAPDRAETLLAEHGLDIELRTYVSHLSGGQRTRLGLAAAIFADPDFLLLDEPTNNLDVDSKAYVRNFVQRWRKGMIIISHDRALLEEMDEIVELTTLGMTRYGGNYTAYKEQKAEELAAAHHTLSDAEKALSQAERKAKEAASRKAKKDAAGRKSRLKGDAPKMQLDAAKARAEASGAANTKLREARRQDIEANLKEAREKIERLEPLSVTLAPSGLPKSKTVLRLSNVTGGYDHSSPILKDVSADIVGPERVSITGRNGSGKTTLLSLISGALEPFEGQVSVNVDFVVLDQEVSLLSPQLSLQDNFLALNPKATSNDARAALARFQFRGTDGLKKAANLSGGQRLRAGLACTLGRPNPPQFIILDEPTNHLDLETIEEMEAALKAYDGAMLVVSHDETFLDNISITRRIDLTALNPG